MPLVIADQLNKSNLSFSVGPVDGVSTAGVCGADGSRGSSNNERLYKVCTSPAFEVRILIT